MKKNSGDPELLPQFLRFAAVGALGFGVDAGTLMLAVHTLSLNLYFGRLISFLTAASFTWALNRRVTFRTVASRSYFGEWLRFLLSNSVGGLVNFGVYAGMIHELSLARQAPYLAVAAGSIAGLFVNFSLTKVFVFRASHA